MIWQQWKMLVWIRWRVTINKLQKSGAIGTFLATLLVVLSVASVLITFFGSIAFGTMLLSEASQEAVFMTWAVILFVMMIFWIVGLSTELQRSELLSLKQLLHLPIGGRSIFLLNFASSFACLTMLVFVPLLFGLAIAHVIVFGPAMLLLFPLIGSLILLLASATYQLRGWLALIMEDKRRAKNIAAFSVVFIIGLSQLPQLFTFYSRRTESERRDGQREISELIKDYNKGQLTKDELTEVLAAQSQKRADGTKRTFEFATTISKYVPPGWLPYSAYRLHRGDVVPAVWRALAAFA